MSTGTGIRLDDRDQGTLAGEHGAGAALAMRVLLATARAMGAREFTAAGGFPAYRGAHDRYRTS